MDQINTPIVSTANMLPGRGSSVFLVEDDEAARHSLSASLEALGFKVRSFSTCEEFLDNAAKLGPGCLLLDYHFDGMNGLDLLHRMKSSGTSIPTVLFSGRFGGYLRKMASNIPGVVAVLDKPLDGRHLLDALRVAQSRL